MRWGIGSYACAWAIGGVPGFDAPDEPMDAMGLLERAHELGVSLVEFSDNLPLAALSEGDLQSLAANARAWDIELRLGLRGMDERVIERCIALCQTMRSPTLRVVVDSATDTPTPDQVIARIRSLLPKLAEARVTLGIENHDRFKASDLAEIMTRLDSPWVGVVLDTVNSFGALEGPQVVVETLKPWVRVVHIKDFAIERISGNMGFALIGAPAGAGRLDVPWLLDALDAEGRAIGGVIELWPPYQGDLARTIALEAQWLCQSVEFMRDLVR